MTPDRLTTWRRRASFLASLFVLSSLLLVSPAVAAEPEVVSFWGTATPTGEVQTADPTKPVTVGTHFIMPAGSVTRLRVHALSAVTQPCTVTLRPAATDGVTKPFSVTPTRTVALPGLSPGWNEVALTDPVTVADEAVWLVAYRCGTTGVSAGSGTASTSEMVSAVDPDLRIPAASVPYGRSVYQYDGNPNTLTWTGVYGVDLTVALPVPPVDPVDPPAPSPVCGMTRETPCFVDVVSDLAVEPVSGEVVLADSQWQELLLAAGALVFFAGASFASGWRRGRG